MRFDTPDRQASTEFFGVGQTPRQRSTRRAETSVACDQAQHQRMLKTEERQVFALLRPLPMGRYLRGGFSVERHLIKRRMVFGSSKTSRCLESIAFLE